jgi:transposase
MVFCWDNVLMGQKFRTGAAPGQAMLMPADPREWLPAGHLAWRVLEMACEMDLSQFGASYRRDGQGGRPYDPAMMATLLLYCYCRGRRSSREIEMATFDDVGARVICGGLHPDHSTAAEFVRGHFAAVCGLLPESVRACVREGLVSLELVAGDGTKLKANAAMSSNATAAQLEAQIAELEDLIAAEVWQWAQDMLDGEDPPPGGGPGHRSDGGASGAKGKKPKKTPKRAQQTLARRKAARAQLAARQEQKNQQELQARVAELEARVQKKQAAVARWEAAAAARLEARARKTAAGQRVSGPRPVTDISQDREVKRARQALAKTRADCEAARQAAAAPAGDPEAKINTADPSSRVMPLKKGGFDQLFNVQALATAKTQIILAITRHDSPVDARALAPLLEKAREVLDAAGITGEILKALFDAGYASDANFTLDIPAELYIAVTREARQTGRSEDGRATETMLPSWQDMTARLDTPEGKALYKKRSPTIEPVFAQLTARLGRTLNSRGDHADAELSLWAASHNLLKAIKARAARQARAAATAAPAPAAA